ncbi:MAG: nickel pincer cofactor biosynthesis protein LarB [Propionibacteriaceae bacterium]|nr:nickel pincer cofactor biosynthesis protein LarB [Propionibacteriaceae bacterium]
MTDSPIDHASPAGPGGLDPLADIATLDLDRARRRGYPEAVFCEGKTADQVARIAQELARRQAPALFTRTTPDTLAGVLSCLPDAGHDESARLAWWPRDVPDPSGALVVVACAGTSDLPVAREAWLTARFLGRDARLIVDVGVAGLHRILAHLDLLRDAGAIVVVAGMDGALPSVVAGLVSCPVVAVPTSVGYGASFDGLAALLSMLNACAPGVAVVNIDNGYGAGHLAAQITAAPSTATPPADVPPTDACCDIAE